MKKISLLIICGGLLLPSFTAYGAIPVKEKKPSFSISKLRQQLTESKTKRLQKKQEKKQIAERKREDRQQTEPKAEAIKYIQKIAFIKIDENQDYTIDFQIKDYKKTLQALNELSAEQSILLDFSKENLQKTISSYSYSVEEIKESLKNNMIEDIQKYIMADQSGQLKLKSINERFLFTTLDKVSTILKALDLKEIPVEQEDNHELLNINRTKLLNFVISKHMEFVNKNRARRKETEYAHLLPLAIDVAEKLLPEGLRELQMHEAANQNLLQLAKESALRLLQEDAALIENLNSQYLSDLQSGSNTLSVDQLEELYQFVNKTAQQHLRAKRSDWENEAHEVPEWMDEDYVSKIEDYTPEANPEKEKYPALQKLQHSANAQSQKTSYLDMLQDL